MPDTLIITTPGFPQDEADTTCLPPQQVFVKALKETYPNLHLIVLTLQYPFTPGNYVWHGIEVIAFGGKGRGGLYRRFTWLKAWRRLRQLHAQHRIIGILSFWLGEASFVGSRFAKRRGIKHYSWLLGQDAKAHNNYVRRIKPESDELIAISDFVAKQYQHNYQIKPAHVIPVGVQMPVLDGTVVRDIDILAAGSLIPLKRYHLLAALVHELKKEFPGIKAVLCGDGPELVSLKILITELKIESNLVLAGELPHQQVLDMMQRVKVFVHPSEYEGFSTVCLEALYAGASVLSFIKPMDVDIANWYIANTQEEMVKRASALLGSFSTRQQPNTPYLVTDNVKTMMRLFNYSE